jgi:hypothetical protein
MLDWQHVESRVWTGMRIERVERYKWEVEGSES